MLGLPDGITACLFDLDGVLTKTAVVHARAWKTMFDDYLGERGTFEDADYNDYVDGKPREDGIRDFLASRDIHPSEAEIRDARRAQEHARPAADPEQGVEAYPGSVAYLRALDEAGLARAVVSSSHNCRAVLEAAGIAGFFEVRVDGDVSDELRPARASPPRTPSSRARAGSASSRDQAAVFEDALAGVEAGRAGSFGHVIGVDRVGHREALLEHGADVVVDDLDELL